MDGLKNKRWRGFPSYLAATLLTRFTAYSKARRSISLIGPRRLLQTGADTRTNFQVNDFVAAWVFGIAHISIARFSLMAVTQAAPCRN